MKRKINNIQGLRAFAAVAVVIFHTGYVLPLMTRSMGYFGVDVFFVISGYIMSGICATNADYFLRRRILRIVPPYWVMTLLLFIVASRYPVFVQATRADTSELFKSLLFIPFVKASGLIQPLLFVGWSLNYEMYFYVALAVALVIWRKRAAWLASGMILAIILIAYPFRGQNVFAEFYGGDRSLDFVLGIAVFYICRAIPTEAAVRWRVGSLVGLVISAASLVVIQGILPLTQVSEVIAAGLPSVLLIATASLLAQGGWDLKLKSLILIGDASYILYLIHPYVEYFCDRVLAHRLSWLNVQHAPGAAITTLASILAAVIIHVTLERPVSQFLHRKLATKPNVLQPAVASLV